MNLSVVFRTVECYTAGVQLVNLSVGCCIAGVQRVNLSVVFRTVFCMTV